MIANKQDIIATFVNTFIVKSKRERAIHELNKKRDFFVDKLNHAIPEIFKEKSLKRINDPGIENVKKKLKVSSNTSCYIISHTDSDDTIMTFEDAFNSLFGNGLGFCIIPINGQRIYLEGEQEVGAPMRYLCYAE